MDEIKKAFQKVKEDIESVKSEIKVIKDALTLLTEKLDNLYSNQRSLIIPTKEGNSTDIQHMLSSRQTDRPAHNSTLYGPKSQDMTLSMGNEGVPADRQTDQQTDRQTHSKPQDPFSNASQLLDSLDAMKRSLRIKFKHLTDQEFLVFSTIYQLGETHEFDIIDYSLLSRRLDLTESSIRDYIARLIKKEIPLDKIKINNKKVNLSIPPSFKKMASLQTLIALRDI